MSKLFEQYGYLTRDENENEQRLYKMRTDEQAQYVEEYYIEHGVKPTQPKLSSKEAEDRALYNEFNFATRLPGWVERIGKTFGE